MCIGLRRDVPVAHITCVHTDTWRAASTKCTILYIPYPAPGSDLELRSSMFRLLSCTMVHRLDRLKMAFLCPHSHAPVQHLGAQLGGSLPLYTTDLCQGGRSNDRLTHPAAYAPVELNPSEEATNQPTNSLSQALHAQEHQVERVLQPDAKMPRRKGRRRRALELEVHPPYA